MADADILTPRSDPKLRKRPATNTSEAAASPRTASTGAHLSAGDAHQFPGGRLRSRSTSLRVLFMHGLESSAHGPKFQILNESFETTAIQMPMKHLRSVNGNPLFLATLALAGFSGCSVLVILWRHYMGHTTSRALTALLSIGVAAMGAWSCNTLKQRGIRFMVEECVKLQTRALCDAKPDVVVGSSWGGAIVVQCLIRGIWRGPSLLLAPAQDRVAAHAGVDKPVLSYRLSDHNDSLSTDGLSCTSDSTVLIVHGKDDTVVPLADSKDFIVRSHRAAKLLVSKIDSKSCPNAPGPETGRDDAQSCSDGSSGAGLPSWCSIQIVSDSHRLSDFAKSGKLVTAVREVMNAHHSRADKAKASSAL